MEFRDKHKDDDVSTKKLQVWISLLLTQVFLYNYDNFGGLTLLQLSPGMSFGRRKQAWLSFNIMHAPITIKNVQQLTKKYDNLIIVDTKLVSFVTMNWELKPSSITTHLYYHFQ